MLRRAKMLRQTCEAHLIRERRQLGARRQHLLVEGQEVCQLIVRDTNDNHITISLSAQTILINAVPDVQDVELAYTQTTSVPRCHSKFAKRDVLQGAR